MANIENKDKTPQENQGKVKETLQKTKEKVQKLSWWAKLFLFCFFFFIFSIFSVLVLINTPWGQNRIAKFAIDEFVNKGFGTTFETENVEINFLGDVIISEVSAKDHHGMEFFKAKKLIGHSDWFNLIFNSRDLKFQKLGLEKLDLKVITYKGEDQDNFTKFIEKFDSPKNPKKTPFKMTSRIEIKDSKISIVNENSGEDGKWLKAEKFNTYVSNLQVVGPDVKLKLNRMSFITERWGKKHFLETLSGDLAITKEKFAFTDLIFNTDQSLLQGDLIFHLDKKTGWKNFNNKVKWEMNLKQGSRLHGYDLSYFVTKWDAHQPYQLTGKMNGILNDFTLKDFSIRANENTIKTPEIRLAKLLKGNFHIRANQLFADLDYPNLRASMPEFIAKRMGKFADDFGKIHYNGLADINKERILAKGKLNTSVGNAQVEQFTLSEYSTQSPKYESIVVLDKFNSTAITKKTEVGKISGNFQVSGRGFDLNTLSLTTKSQISQMELLGKIWQNIRIDGDLIAKKFDGLIQIANAEARGNITGKIDFSTPRLLADIRGNIDYLNLAHLGISSKKSIFKGNIDGRLAMTNLNDLDLDATINSATIWGEKPISIPNGAVKIAMENGNRVIKVDMPNAINGQIYGKFNVGDLGGIFQNVADRFLVGNKTKHYYNGQNFVMNFEVHQSLVDYFAPDILLPNGVKINGQFIGNQNDWQLNVNAPSLKYIMTKREEISEADKLLAKLNPEYIIRENVTKDSIVSENIDLHLDTRSIEKYWQVSAERVQYQNTLLKNIDISAENQGNQLNIATRLDVGTPEKEKEDKMVAYAANLVQSVNAEGDYVVKFDPTHLKINKFTWQVDTSPELNHSITYRRKQKDFVVQNLRIFSEDSELLVNGTFKNAKDFDIDGKVKNMEIAKLYALANPDSPLEIKGIANGTLKVKMNESTLRPEVDVEVEDISVNENRLGNLSIKAENTDQKNIYNVKAKMLTSSLFGQELLALEGTIDNNTKSPMLDLKTQLNDFDISFVQAFVKNIFSNFRGKASGEMKIEGTLKDLNYGGDIAMKDFGLKLNFSGVDYAFDDTVVNLHNGDLFFNLVGVKDSRKNSKAMVSIGRVSLSDLSNIGAELFIRSEDLMLLNTNQSDFDLFWGKIYAKGNLVVGYSNHTLKIDATADVLPNSVFTLNSNSTSSVDKFKMLRFLEVNEEGKIALAEKKRNGLAMNINLDISADKNSIVNVLVGDEVGDISVRGETKNMTFSMDRTGNIKMNGSYEVESGTYISKAILEKTFQIQKGSKIQWNGDAMNPEMNITASYNALVSNASEYLGVGSLPAINVQLQTQISNNLKNPIIKPLIVAPDVSTQIRDVMATKMATEEEKVLQFASILAIGNFNVANTNASSAVGSGVNLFFKQLSSAFNSISEVFQLDIGYIAKNDATNTGDRAIGNLQFKFSPRFKLKTGIGVPISNSLTTQNNYLSGEGIVEYDWSKTIDGSRILRVYSKPANVGLVAGSNASANQTYGGGVVISYGFDRFFPKKKGKQDSVKVENEKLKTE